MPAVGVGSLVGLASEATYGTYEATNDWCAITACTLKEDRQRKAAGHLLPGGALVTSTTSLVGRDSVHVATSYGGAIDFVPLYDHRSFSVMLAHMFHMAVPAPTGSGPYTYTYDLGLTLTGLSAQVIHGYSAELTDNARRFTGLVCTKWTLTCAAQDVVKITTEWIGTGATEFQAVSGTPAIVDGEEIIAAHGGATSSWNSLNLVLADVSVSVDWKMAESPIVGAYSTAKPVNSDMPETRIRARVKIMSEALHDSYRTSPAPSSDFVLVLTGSGNNLLTITGHNATLLTCDPMVDGTGELFYDCEWVCRSGSSKSGLRAALRNDLSTGES